MPYKNAEPWIAETIRSVLNQDHPDWELLCIDDGSSDNSRNIVEQFAENDPWIRSYTNPETGIISALRHGLNMATGDFITRMDADDLMPPYRLKVMREAILMEKPKTVVTGLVQYFSENEVSKGYLKYEAWLNERVQKNDFFDHVYRECVIASPNWLVRKSDLLDSKIFKEMIYPEDYSMTLLWYEKGFRIKGIQKQTLLWREHPQRTSRNSDIYDQHSFFDLKINHFIETQKPNFKTIALLGAGAKGKITADILKNRGIRFNWYDLDPTKYRGSQHEILSYTLIHEEALLVSVYPEPIEQLNEFLSEKGFSVGKNAWYL